MSVLVAVAVQRKAIAIQPSLNNFYESMYERLFRLAGVIDKLISQGHVMVCRTDQWNNRYKKMLVKEGKKYCFPLNVIEEMYEIMIMI